MMIIMKLNGNALRNARDRKGLTQAEVAEALGMSIATVNKAENDGDIHPGTGKRICELLNIALATAVVPREQENDGDAA